ncbi:hypothetical protein ACFSM5_21170 [Lacibacterium aquatile]|uniref:Uncharacterized protein n=1 Tax=Lacibacterium aquatile TaxID=1168082 RepID=A0ABW5DWF5_9PROT
MNDKIEVIDISAGDRLMLFERIVVSAALAYGAARLFQHVAVGIVVFVVLGLSIHLVTRSNIGQRIWHGASTVLWAVAGFGIARALEADPVSQVAATLIPGLIAFVTHRAWRRVSDRIRMID